MARKAAADAKRDEAARNKEALRQLEKAEQEALEQSKKPKDHVPKITRMQIQQQLEAKAGNSPLVHKSSQQCVVFAAESDRFEKKRSSSPLRENLNHSMQDLDLSGTGLEDSLAAFEGQGLGERHPERRAKAAWNAFFERRLAEEKQVFCSS